MMKKRDLEIWSERRTNKRLYSHGGYIKLRHSYLVGEKAPEPFPFMRPADGTLMVSRP